MNCCQCQGIETEFDRERARQDLAAYREDGPSETTQILIDALQAEGVEGLTLLDIGGGVGAVQHELVGAGVQHAIGVDASAAYIDAARREAERQGHADRMSFHHSNFVDLSPSLPAADIVTLDRVICCYHDMEALVGLSAARAGKLYGVVYPRDTWWMKLANPVLNLRFRIQRNPFRVFVHPTAVVDALIRSNGLQQRFYHTTFLWQIVVYGR